MTTRGKREEGESAIVKIERAGEMGMRERAGEREMDRDGERWREIDRDGERRREMGRGRELDTEIQREKNRCSKTKGKREEEITPAD